MENVKWKLKNWCVLDTVGIPEEGGRESLLVEKHLVCEAENHPQKGNTYFKSEF